MPKLSDEGRAVLSEVRAIGHGVGGLRAKVKGLEAEVNFGGGCGVAARPSRQRLKLLCRDVSAGVTAPSRGNAGAITAIAQDGAVVRGISGPLAARTEHVDWTAARAVAMIPLRAPITRWRRWNAFRPGRGANTFNLF